MVRLETVLDSWRVVREDAAQALLELPPDKLDFRGTPELMSAREIARHILEVGHAFPMMLLDGVDNLATPELKEMVKRYAPVPPPDADAATLAAALRDSGECCRRELAKQSPEFYSGIVTRFDGEKVTRLELVQWTKEHEMVHRTYLFVYLRMAGMVPPTTRRKLARK